MATFVHLIADYGSADPAFSEVVHRLKAEDPTIDVRPTAVSPLSTVATGFWIEQLGVHNPAFEELLIYSNAAPRTEDASPQRAETGGPLCYLTLESGVPVVAVDAGYNLSFVRERIEEVREIDVPETDSQFRSRDHFPKRVVELAGGDETSLGKRRSIEDLPPRPESVVCHVDGYGNVKTSIRASELEVAGETVTIEINGVRTAATVREAVSDLEEGTVGLVPGSAGGEDPYVEVFSRGGSAAATFDRPQPGDEIRVQE